MNKRGHHELGLAPYAIIGSLFASIGIVLRRIFIILRN